YGPREAAIMGEGKPPEVGPGWFDRILDRTTGTTGRIALLIGAIIGLLALVPPGSDRARTAYCAIWGCEFHWSAAGRQGDCSVPADVDFPGFSIPPWWSWLFSPFSWPDHLKPSDGECYGNRVGLAAVCWDKKRDFDPPNLGDAVKGKPYCLYKRKKIDDCFG